MDARWILSKILLILSIKQQAYNGGPILNVCVAR